MLTAHDRRVARSPPESATRGAAMRSKLSSRTGRSSLSTPSVRRRPGASVAREALTSPHIDFPRPATRLSELPPIHGRLPGAQTEVFRGPPRAAQTARSWRCCDGPSRASTEHRRSVPASAGWPSGTQLSSPSSRRVGRETHCQLEPQKFTEAAAWQAEVGGAGMTASLVSTSSSGPGRSLTQAGWSPLRAPTSPGAEDDR